MAKQKQSLTTKIKKKRWIRILPADIFKDREIGETYITEPEEVIGRVIQANMMALTGDPKKQNIQLSFKVKSVKDDKALCEMFSYSLLPSSVRRIVRREKTRMDDSILIQTKDNIVLRIKPLIVTKAIVRGMRKNGLRLAMKLFLIRKCTSNEAKVLFEEVAYQRLQKDMRDVLQKIYPLAACEIREMIVSVGKTNVKPYTADSIKEVIKKEEAAEEKNAAISKVNEEEKTEEEPEETASEEAVENPEETQES
jgi:ribosomal protein S3AE